MLALGIDPSLSATGIAALDLEAGKVLDWEAIITSVGDSKSERALEDMASRLHDIGSRVRAFCARHQGVVVIEGQSSSSFGGPAGMAGVGKLMAAYGAIIASLPRKPVVLHPVTVKKRVTGHKDASKEAAWQAALMFVPDHPPLPKSKKAQEAVKDAVITAIAGMPEINQIYSRTPDTE